MNSDSILESEFLHEHKSLITLFITVSLAFLTIFWLYKGLKSDGTNVGGQVVNTNNTRVINSKRRLTINAENVLYKSLKSIDIDAIYQVLDNLSKHFDLFLIILISESEDTNAILSLLNVLVEDKIILKHVFIII